MGDAAIQDAMITNMRLRLPHAQFSGISLNCENFAERHGKGGFPLCISNIPFYGMSHRNVAEPSREGETFAQGSSQKKLEFLIKRVLKRAPGLRSCLKTVHAWVSPARREFRHFVEGYRFLRTQDILIVSGGGQLDDSWGGPWAHPYALFKWAMIAKIAKVPFVFASVGAGPTSSVISRWFLSQALRMARYRSYRDNNSRNLVVNLFSRAKTDCVVPDLAFSLPSAVISVSAGVRLIARGRTVVAISPIAYAKPGNWPWQDKAVYTRYLLQMVDVVSELLKRGYFLVFVWSSVGDDESVIPELLERLDDECKVRLAEQICIPHLKVWQDFAALLCDSDLLIGSRLHSIILSFLTQTPAVAIAAEPKVDWLMQDINQTEYLLHINDFTAKDVISALDRMLLRRDAIVETISSHRQQTHFRSSRQYDVLADFSMSKLAGCAERQSFVGL
jgi:polysaccharide pyruvyl transferase WcaK-like protein